MKPKDFLNNYYADLEYQFKQNGIESVNYNSAGTPCFETEAECVEYMKDLKTLIDYFKYREQP
tara:strand:- start:431 stop:619 length:189 start_codon:yes stop_codon:yes gene_type:complete